MNTINTRSITYTLLYSALCLLYILLYMPYGFEDTDTGYILGSSWNIYNGQLPHRDFIYTRPSIPAYFHTIFIWISETYAFIIDRCFFYVQIFVYSYLGASLLCHKFSIRDPQIKYTLAALAALVSIHNYPPMGWNTIDGVFFCMLGLYLILQESYKTYKVALGSLVLVLGVFSKQSFYFMPIFIFVYLLLLKDYKKLRTYVLFGLVAVMGYFLFKYSTGSLQPFWEQTFQRTPTSALYEAGFKHYYDSLRIVVLYVILSIGLIWAAKRYLKNQLAYALFTAGVLGLIALFFIQSYGSWTAIPYIFQVLFLACSAFAVVRSITDARYYLVVLLLTLSWSASISNGYRTPIHFSLPLIFGSYLFFIGPNAARFKPWIPLTLIVLCFGTFYLGYQTTYRDSNRNELTYAMGDVYPELTGIKSDKATFDKYQELRQLSKNYPNFTVLPSATLAHFITKTVNPIGTDWPIDVEINYQAEALTDTLARKDVTVFLEEKEYSEYQLDSYTIKRLIESQWKLVQKGTHFNVYQSK